MVLVSRVFFTLNEGHDNHGNQQKNDGNAKLPYVDECFFLWRKLVQHDPDILNSLFFNFADNASTDICNTRLHQANQVDVQRIEIGIGGHVCQCAWCGSVLQHANES